MTHDVVMPQLGLTMIEGSVSVWLKKPGDRIEKGEVLFSVETDKVEMEVEATVSGFVALEVTKPKQVVPVGTVIAVIVDREEEIAAAASVDRGPATAEAFPQPAAEVLLAGTDGEAAKDAAVQQVPASPLAKQLARKLGVDLRGLKPAKGGRISADDVQRAHAAQTGIQHAAVAAAPPVELQVSAGRTAIADRVTASFRGAPHFYLGVEVDATQLVDLRTRSVEAARKEEVRITYTDFFVKALARALTEQPAVNRFWHDGKIFARQSIDVGFAAQAEESLLVPVIRNVDQLTILEVARERIRLAEKVRAGTLNLPEMEGGSATLSNLGAFGIDWLQAILNPPQSVIVATGRIAKRPAIAGDRLAVRDTVMVTASIDHRVLDGVAGAKFLARIKELLQDPAMLML